MSVKRSLLCGAVLWFANVPTASAEGSASGSTSDSAADSTTPVEEPRRAVPQGLDHPQVLQLGLFGDLAIDDGEVSTFLAGSADWVVWRGFLLHGGLSFEEKVDSFIRFRGVLGIGHLREWKRSSLAAWLAPGLTTTGLWDHYLHREFLGAGIGYRCHLASQFGLGLNLEGAFYRRGITEQRASVGFIYVKRRAGHSKAQSDR